MGKELVLSLREKFPKKGIQAFFAEEKGKRFLNGDVFYTTINTTTWGK